MRIKTYTNHRHGDPKEALVWVIKSCIDCHRFISKFSKKDSRCPKCSYNHKVQIVNKKYEHSEKGKKRAREYMKKWRHKGVN